ncbi:hypothetical protein DPEC_G00210210 [Dallia pectoralis]|uniref:Uncharacterized protein n=1 Tax=Dallia pectoralis TaxID=75939 RepID=A0ACC2G5V8_DALPE|nr:hypothetical protein DPEC_G00210210 [Dallia pectoralis]
MTEYKLKESRRDGEKAAGYQRRLEAKRQQRATERDSRQRSPMSYKPSSISHRDTVCFSVWHPESVVELQARLGSIQFPRGSSIGPGTGRERAPSPEVINGRKMAAAPA